MGRTRSYDLDSVDCRCRRDIAGSGSSARAWTSDGAVGPWRRRDLVSNAGRYGCLWVHAGGPDGDCVRVVDDLRLDGHTKTRGEHVGEVFWRSKAMKKLFLPRDAKIEIEVVAVLK